MEERALQRTGGIACEPSWRHRLQLGSACELTHLVSCFASAGRVVLDQAGTSQGPDLGK